MGRAGGRDRVWLFLGLTCVLTAPFWALAITTGESAGGRGAYAVGMMWGPGIAAIATCWLSGMPIAGLGWHWGRTRWQTLSCLWPLAVCAIAYGFVFAAGLGGFPDPKSVAALRDSLGWPHAPSWLVVSGWFLLLSTTGLVRGIASALGEEIGWRGFLAPTLHARFGFTAGALLTGAAWAAWHLPIMIFSDYASATPPWFAIPCFVIEVLSLSVVMSWIRMRSGSLWTGAIAHASINLFNQGYFAPLTEARGAVTAYAIDESGAVLPVVLFIFALLAWMRWRSTEPDAVVPSRP